MLFTKMQGLGNDFIIIQEEELKPNIDLSQLAIKICDRHFGIGADGLMLVAASTKADLKMQIINADGSEAEMCGNGIRCFAKYVYEHGIAVKPEITVETLAGIIVPKFNFVDDKIASITVDMGEPQLARQQIPILGAGEPAINESLIIDDKEYLFTAVSMGNPHCVIFVNNVNEIPLNIVGRKIENNYLFPRKTNVEFVQILNPTEVKMRVWERGAAETLACGTGACAVAVAGVLNSYTKREIIVHLAGGDLNILWDAKDNHLYMTGPAWEVFTGQLKI